MKEKEIGSNSEPPSKQSFIIGKQAESFRSKYYSQASETEWNDWAWQVRNRIKDVKELDRIFRLSPEEKENIVKLRGLPIGVTPYYASIVDLDNPLDPIRKTVVPSSQELIKSPGEADDPLAEDSFMPVPGLVHRYPDRVLFLITNFCATYCRYCTRARMIGQPGENNINVQQALDYISSNPQIRDVLISGGDPLSLSDGKLDKLLGQIRAIPHVEFVRIGTKVPVVLPQRITPELVSVLRKHMVWLSIHFMHAVEITPEIEQACARLADGGIPLGSQTVLTLGVNDDVETMKNLMHKLLRNRVRPYYIYQCDPITGSAHFRTPFSKGMEIISGLRGYTTGYAVPTFVVDAPGGGGKIPLYPDPIIEQNSKEVVLRNYEGKPFSYPLTQSIVTCC